MDIYDHLLYILQTAFMAVIIAGLFVFLFVCFGFLLLVLRIIAKELLPYWWYSILRYFKKR